MPLRQAIRDTVAELFDAIPDRIEVSGHGPTKRVTGGSFEGVLGYVGDAMPGAVVVGREDHTRWWPRVTLTVTTDPELAATAPPLETFADPEPEPEPEPEREADHHAGAGLDIEPEPAPVQVPAAAEVELPASQPQQEERWVEESVLEQMFAYQEDVRRRRLGIPEQRRRDADT